MSGISIQVKTHYLAEHSSPAIHRFAFAYSISITNNGDAPVQLLSRHWIITDAEGAVQEVKGAGVVGQQPVLQPGEQFEYTSGCTIASPVGTMKGSYFMEAADGRQFDAPIAEFTLAMPRTLH